MNGFDCRVSSSDGLGLIAEKRTPHGGQELSSLVLLFLRKIWSLPQTFSFIALLLQVKRTHAKKSAHNINAEFDHLALDL